MSSPSNSICPFHKIHHKKLCQQIKQLRRQRQTSQVAVPKVPQPSNPRRGGRASRSPATAPSNAQSRPSNRAASLPEVTWDAVVLIKGAPATVVSTYSMDSKHRTTLHPAFVNVRLKKLVISYQSYCSPQSVSGRLWMIVQGTNETVPSTGTIKAHHEGWSCRADQDATKTITPGKYEPRLLVALQEGHHYGGVKFSFLPDCTHSGNAAATTDVGCLKISATFTYTAHADL